MTENARHEIAGHENAGHVVDFTVTYSMRITAHCVLLCAFKPTMLWILLLHQYSVIFVADRRGAAGDRVQGSRPPSRGQRHQWRKYFSKEGARRRGAVGVEGVGCDGGGWAPSPEKINKKSFLSPK